MNLPPGKKDIAKTLASIEYQEALAIGISKKIWHSDPTRSVVDTAWCTAAQAQSAPICEWDSTEELSKEMGSNSVGPIEKSFLATQYHDACIHSIKAGPTMGRIYLGQILVIEIYISST